MEEENNEKKRQVRLAIIGVVALLLLTLGATFAYFLIDTDNSTSKSNIKGDISKAGVATLVPGTSNLHINLKAEDMAEAKQGTEYYGDELESNPYVLSEEEGTHTISQVQITDGEETTKYSCTAKVVVTMEISEDNNMGSVLEPGDLILQFKGNIISDKLDLSEIKNEGTKEYNISFKLTGNTTENIQAYIKLLNKEEPQNYLANKNLKVDINTTELSCDIYVENPIVAKLRKDSTGTLSEDIKGDMYRYQGTENVPNYICFGTTDKEECINEETGIDKYMYRILGISEEGQLKLIKETAVKEGEFNTFSWNNKSGEEDCQGDACEWPNSLIYKRINGISNGENPESDYIGNTDIFVDSEYYNYLKSGDGINGESEESTWYQLIENHNWKYGDSEIISNADDAYLKESGFVDKIEAKIGLMYMYDFDYCSKEIPSYKNWINPTGDFGSQFWTMTRYGFHEDGVQENYWWWVNYVPFEHEYKGQMYSRGSVRPTFYLNSDVSIKSGNGTKSDPYILDVQE